jgi:glycosyltransferase involved in cell wall biosynthesis
VVKKIIFAVPGELTIPTGGYAYDRRIVAELGALRWSPEVINLGEGFPFPDAMTRMAAHQLLQALPGDSPIVIDGLAFGALPEVAEQLGASHDLIALVHHPLALESGLSQADCEALRVSERRALACARRVIVTSAFTARLIISDYGIPADRVAIAPPGVDKAPRARAIPGAPVALLAVGAIVQRKGYDVLLAALARLVDLRWRLTIVGDRGRDSDAAARLDRDIARFDLADRVTVAGAVPAAQLAALYAQADLFVLASRFEGYGMAFAEAIAHGLPVVGTTAGAIAETVPAGVGRLVPPDDIEAFSLALRRLIGDSAERRRLAEAAWREAAKFPDWRRSAESFSEAIPTIANALQNDFPKPVTAIRCAEKSQSNNTSPLSV